MAIALHAFFPKISHRNMQKNQQPLSHQKIQQKNLRSLRVIIPIFVIIIIIFFCSVISHIVGRSLKMFWHSLRHKH